MGSSPDAPEGRTTLSLSTKVLIGLGLGILSGIFFGEKVAFLKVFGDSFVLLLQMTVLPYIIVSLISGLGGLSLHAAASLARKCGALPLLLWTVGLLIVLVIPFAFPKWETASFFSTSLIEPRQPFDFLRLYIPANLFYSLANNVVPAVVVFSFAFGVALPLCYGVARGDRDLVDFVNAWIELKRNEQTISSLYNYWILGRRGGGIEPRWSVIRNVLHLVD